MLQSKRRTFLAALTGGLVSWAFFASRAPMRVRVGLVETEERVPALYQAAAFFAFTPFAVIAIEELFARSPRRFAVVMATGALSVVRLAGELPTSGHAIFLGAALAFDALAPRSEARDARLACSALAAATTMVFKGLWGDLGWGVASAGAGMALGALASIGRERA